MARIKRTKRQLVVEKFKKRCAYCGMKLTEYNQTIDHIKPRKHGGTNAIENLFPCCPNCNSRKSDMSVDEFRDHLMDKLNSVFYGTRRRKKIVFYFEKKQQKL